MAAVAVPCSQGVYPWVGHYKPGALSEPQSSSAQPLLLPCNLPMVSGVWMVIGLLSPSCSGAHSINVTHGQMFLFLGKNNL